MIGAADDEQGGVDAGVIHIYAHDGSTYAFIQTLGNGSPAANEKFGFTLTALAGDFAVSAVNDNLGAAAAGAVYRVGYDVNPPTPTATATAGPVYLPILHRP